VRTVPAPENVRFPYTVQKWNSRATIYRTQRVKDGRTYFEFRVATYDSEGRRRLDSFSEFGGAVKAAEAKLLAIGRGLVDTVTLSGQERLDYLAATKLLPPGTTLAEAVRCLIRSKDAPKAVPISVADLIDAFIEGRTAETRHGRPASEAYLRDVRQRLGRFAEAFRCDVASLTGPLIEQWLIATRQTGRNRFNSQRLIRTLLKWAQKRGHLTPGALPTDALDFAAPLDGDIEIFTPAELRKILDAAKPQMLPYVALGAFAGLRTAEIQRLDWSDLKLDRGFIEVGRDKAKTRSRRLIPVLPPLKAWLGPLHQDYGEVLPFVNVAKQVGWLARDAGVTWKHNGLRHSFISYRLADLQSADRVALEAGNSPGMVFRHYRELVTPQEAAEWFAILPG
jgi:integrase